MELIASKPIGRTEPACVAADKFLGLEIVRFVCAFAVLLWHYRHFYALNGSPTFVQSAQPLHAILAPLYDYGLFGVQLFWAISGFIFFWKYGSAIAARTVDAVSFFWLRLSRLYPLHLATLISVALLQPVHQGLTGHNFIYEGNAAQFSAHLLMATHWGGPAQYSFNGPVWSVSSEIAVYAGFFLLVRYVGAGWKTICAGLAISLAGQALGISSSALFCAGYFFAGAAAAQLFLDARAAGRAKQLTNACLGLLLAGAAFLALADVAITDQNLKSLMLFAAPPLLIIAARDWTGLSRWGTMIRAAGNLTYSTYLIHFPLQLLVAIACTATGIIIPAQNPIMLIAYLATAIIAGRGIYLKFELPAQRWIRQRTLMHPA